MLPTPPGNAPAMTPAPAVPVPPPSYQVWSRAQHVTDHHFDPSRPGRPLQWLIPGAIIGIFALLLLLAVGYQTFVLKTMDPGTGVPLVIMLGLVYAGGVYAFAYGYELYDTAKAIRMTVIIVGLTIA